MNLVPKNKFISGLGFTITSFSAKENEKGVTNIWTRSEPYRQVN
jgi:hypothetical protein